MEKQIHHLVSELKASIQEDPLQGAGALVEFAMENASDNKQVHQALVLKMNYMQSADQGKKEQLVADMLALADRFSSTSSGGGMAVAAVSSAQALQVVKKDDIVCEGRNINKVFRRGGFGLKDIDFCFRLGEITGVVGENGNGKTTLFRIAVGELAADSGVLHFPYIEGQAGVTTGNWERIKEHIAFIPQDIERWYGSVKDNLHYELAVHGILDKENLEEVEYIIYRLGLEKHQNKSWNQLSGGYKLRFALARALVWKPKLLVIDEPLANLDIKAQLIILNDLRDLANSYRYPLSIVISSQHLHEIENVSDRIIFLKEGNMIFNGRVDELGNERQENTFEFASDLSVEELERRLAGFEYYSLENTGLAYVIRTPLSITYQELFQIFLKAEIPIGYFRDISQSTKKLFV